MDRRESNIEVFEDTQRLYRTNPTLVRAVEESVKAQAFIDGNESFSAELAEHRYTVPAKVTVSKKRTLEAAAGYAGQKVCVLNFASATNPGGGVTRGSNAQEEAICRCSTLYPCLDNHKMRECFYYKHKSMLKNGVMDSSYNDDCIFTPSVTVFKTDTSCPKLMSEDKWYSVDVITCAAPNLRERPSNRMNPNGGSNRLIILDVELKKLHVKRAERIFEIAKANGAEMLILGAFGCGAFRNPPRIVAAAYAEVLKKYAYDFEAVEFAVYCSQYDTGNYDTFKRIIGMVK